MTNQERNHRRRKKLYITVSLKAFCSCPLNKGPHMSLCTGPHKLCSQTHNIDSLKILGFVEVPTLPDCVHMVLCHLFFNLHISYKLEVRIRCLSRFRLNKFW